MNNLNLIYENAKMIAIPKFKYNKPIIIRIRDEFFTSKSLEIIVGKLKFLKKYSKIYPLHVIFDLDKITFADKVTYIIFDMILYDLIKTTIFNIDIALEYKESIVVHNGLSNTAFFRTIQRTKGELVRNIYIEEYEKKIHVTDKTFRRLISRELLDKDKSFPSFVTSEVETFLKGHYEDSIWINDICETIGELIDNTDSHTNSDCLVDIDVCQISPEVAKEHFNNSALHSALNIVVINFSNNRIFDTIKKYVQENLYPYSDPLYKDIYKAFCNHEQYFNKSEDVYEEDDFFFITAFQNGVTSRELTSGNSGTGLTTLIKNIIGKTVHNYSYVLSGNNIIYFIDEFLQVSTSKMIGFNVENDYINRRPDKKIIERSVLYIPGTIYELVLVKESKNA